LLIIIIIYIADLRESEVLFRNRWLWSLRPCMGMSLINPCRGWLWSVKRIKGHSAKEDEAVNLSWRLLPGKPLNSLMAVEPKGSIPPKRGTLLHRNLTGLTIFQLALSITNILKYISSVILIIYIYKDDIN